jgi:class 3 adenylate cyclase
MAKAEKARLERQQQMKVQAREREAREAERRAQEQVEQERLAALSEVQREAEAFKARMEKGEGRNEGPVCALLADLKAFVRGLEKLSPEDAKAVDEVLRRAYLHAGVDLKKNKKAKAFIKEFRQRNALQ